MDLDGLGPKHLNKDGLRYFKAMISVAQVRVLFVYHRAVVFSRELRLFTDEIGPPFFFCLKRALPPRTTTRRWRATCM